MHGTVDLIEKEVKGSKSGVSIMSQVCLRISVDKLYI